MPVHVGSKIAVAAAALLWILLHEPARAEPRVEKLADTTVDTQALTIQGAFGQSINGLSFQQEALTSYAGYQYLGYYDAARHVCLARRKLPAGSWEVLRLTDYDFRSNDAHNTISVGLCPADGTLHLSFDHHVHPLHYRRSRAGVATSPADVTWSPELFGPLVTEFPPGEPLPKITYPRFWRTPEGGLQFCYRVGASGKGDRMLADYDPATGSWKNVRQIDSRQGTYTEGSYTNASRCSYPNSYTYDANGRLHVTWVWRENSQGSNHDLNYAFSDDRGFTWRNNAGQLIADTRVPGKVMALDSPGLVVVPISLQMCLMNTQAQAVDSQGQVHVVMWHATQGTLLAAKTKTTSCWGPPEARRYHHYYRTPAGTWKHVELPEVAGNRPRLFFDRQDNAWLTFKCRRVGEGDGDTDNRRVFFVNGDLAIMSATAAAQWTDWKRVHTEPGPFMNEMLGDPYRWQSEGVLSILVQTSPAKPHDPTPLRVLDFRLQR